MGFSKLGGRGRGNIPHFQYPHGLEKGAQAGSPFLQMRSRHPSAGGAGVPEWGHIYLRFRPTPDLLPPLGTPVTVPELAFSPSSNFQHSPCPYEQTVEVGMAPRLAHLPWHPLIPFGMTSVLEASSLKLDRHALFPRTPQNTNPASSQKIKLCSPLPILMSLCCCRLWKILGKLGLGHEGTLSTWQRSGLWR